MAWPSSGLIPWSWPNENGRLKVQELRRAQELITDNEERIAKAWDEHFKQE